MCALRKSDAQPGSVCLPSSSVESVVEAAGARGLPALPNPSLLTRRLLGLRGCKRHLSPSTRRKREMTPTDRKDASYWDKRRKNNEAAKRSREKRRFQDLVLEGQLLALSKQNTQLRAEVLTLQYHIVMGGEPVPVHASLPLAPSQYLKPSPSQPSLWSANTTPLLTEQRGLEELLKGTRVSRSAISGHSSPGPRASQASPGPPNYLRLPGLSQWNECIPEQRPPESSSFTKANKHDKPLGQQLCSGGSGEPKPESAVHQVSSSKDLPGDVEFPSTSKHYHLPPSPHFYPPPHSSFSSSPPLPPPSWLLPGRGHSAVPGSRLLPWGAPCLHPTPLYPNLPFYLPLDDPDMRHQGLDKHKNFKSTISTLSAELAQLRRYFSAENC
ncbi:hypothetical protein AAFF_G00005690 [Aldrovandia affinis]|uniref:BZIP domain-containing protein n=1 Tax=Aldrovandia affinis TaxID=143900 RepID=A0AAD7X3U2_9TELE|nr:hypothetical protein AAFF_G00005690 [Aldrovandia affinis]